MHRPCIQVPALKSRKVSHEGVKPKAVAYLGDRPYSVLLPFIHSQAKGRQSDLESKVKITWRCSGLSHSGRSQPHTRRLSVAGGCHVHTGREGLPEAATNCKKLPAEKGHEVYPGELVEAHPETWPRAFTSPLPLCLSLLMQTVATPLKHCLQVT